MVTCKNCSSEQVVKNGTVRQKQRYKCKSCSYNFVDGDERSTYTAKIKRALSVILYSLGKASFGFLGKLFGVSRVAVYNWIKKEGLLLEEQTISSSIKEIEFDEMWHFVQSKKTKGGLLKPWIVAQGELLPGLSAIVMLKPLDDYMTKLNT